jgi:hypothetical protein
LTIAFQSFREGDFQLIEFLILYGAKTPEPFFLRAQTIESKNSHEKLKISFIKIFFLLLFAPQRRAVIENEKKNINRYGIVM